ncbi:aspartate/glutamate racemase family protein [Rhodospira trueperi]|uniref:Aspartate racemase n=1 Tax=Rhodospira trueperi TaxID=69960 RepID=A0A1G7FNN7_9PROT|nr:amino acid racemase [Rhodospira trueperi]SDE77520.1 aspartate racemase [Rhodospira trueperi]
MPQRPYSQMTIGILGGSSNVATADYYRMINEIANARLGGWDIAETLIAGMNFGNIEALLRADDWAGLQAYMEGHVERLIAGGADVILGVSNTLHRPLEAIMAGRTTPFIHIVDPTGAAIQERGLARIILLGTRPAMEQSYLRDRYEQRFGLTILVPDADERADVDRIIFDELVKFDVREASRRRYLEIVDRLVRDEGAQGVILGCTEIPLLLRPEDRPDLPMFDTAQLHCHAAVAFALASE